MSKLKVLCFNIGYFLGYSGKSGDYLKNPLKAIIGAKNEEAYLLEFLALVRKEDPDFILIQEIDSGSIRSSKANQAAYISERLGEKYDFEFNVKYNNWFIRSLPIFKTSGNALFYKKGI